MKREAPDPGEGYRLVVNGEDAPMDMEMRLVGVTEDVWWPTSCRGMKKFVNHLPELMAYRTRTAPPTYLSRPSRWGRVWSMVCRSFIWWSKSWEAALITGALIGFLTSCSPRVTDPCVTARPPVIGGAPADSILVRDSTNGGCQ